MKVTGVSFSSDKKLVHCQQQYSYRYDEKLQKRIKSKGLFMGSVLHTLIETYRRKGDWEKRLRIWEKKEWKPLFDEEKEGYEEKGMTPKIVHDLMEHYVEHWGAEDLLWKPLFIEQAFEIPTKYGFPIRFKADYIAQKGKVIALFENKNKGDIPEGEERMLAPQPHSYAYLLTKLPQPIHVTRIVWDYIRTEKVPSPKILKNGDLSKREIKTDQRTYLKALKEAGIHPKGGEELIGLENFLKTLPETLTLTRVTNSVNLRVGEMFVRDWVARALQARDIKRPTRNWGRDCKWFCDYRTLCMADMLGTPDRNTIIKKDFVTHIKKAGD
jgi:hypothetical protein